MQGENVRKLRSVRWNADGDAAAWRPYLTTSVMMEWAGLADLAAMLSIQR